MNNKNGLMVKLTETIWEVTLNNILERSSWNWIVDIKRAESVKYIAAVVWGRIKEVFKVISYKASTEQPWRVRFELELAELTLRIQLRNEDVSNDFNGTSNPIKYTLIK